ncbi:MAG: anion permease [Lautropia sp.]|nr:anion permease [Lautropia sp.]
MVAKPWGMPIVLLTAVTGSAVAVGFTPNTQELEMKNVLAGYSSSTTWLVFTAFALSTAFVSSAGPADVGRKLRRMDGQAPEGSFPAGAERPVGSGLCGLGPQGRGKLDDVDPEGGGIGLRGWRATSGKTPL